ncbi:MAG: TPM domain-containing protein, partial [Bacteroidales bacterium]|nr:TPM domain-containing protein [Bacteroidales bacterium]
YKTRERNGVLIYIAHKSKKFAIIGDSGINAVVPPDFWNEVKESLGEYLRKGEVAQGLSVAIGMAGDNLKKFFPYKSDDTNEQSNEISFGE